MTKKLFALLVITASNLFLVHTAGAQPQLSGTPDELRGFLFPRPNTVNISGDAELTAYKDVARVSLLVTTEARSLNAAMADNQNLRNDLIEEFLAAGIDADAINNSKFASSPQYGLFGRNPSSFEVVARLDVEVSSESHLQMLAGAADANEEVEFERIQFEHSEEEEFEQQVQELALQDVMEQKAFYESNLGLELRAVNFFYGSIRQMARAMPMAVMAEAATADSMNEAVSLSAGASVAPSFDEVEYGTSVTVVFEIVRDNQDQINP